MTIETAFQTAQTPALTALTQELTAQDAPALSFLRKTRFLSAHSDLTQVQTYNCQRRKHAKPTILASPTDLCIATRTKALLLIADAADALKGSPARKTTNSARKDRNA